MIQPDLGRTWITCFPDAQEYWGPDVAKRKARNLPLDRLKVEGLAKSGVVTKVLFTILGGVLVKGADVLDNLNRLPSALSQSTHRAYEWWAVDHDWSGRWTNEGCVDCPVPDVFITIDLMVRNGIVSGEVQTPPMIGLLPYPHLMIDGKRVGDEVSGMFYDYVDGRKTRFAEFTMTIAGDRRTVRVTTDPLGIFPKTGDLFKASPYVEAVEAKSP